STVKMTKAAKQNIQAFRGLIWYLRRRAVRLTSVHVLLDELLRRSGYADMLESQRQRLEEKGGGGQGKGRKAAASGDPAEETYECQERLRTLMELAGDPESWVADAYLPDTEQEGTMAERGLQARLRAE
ncbi:hypothetical protein Agub_g8670, partial [Astrephomene gubernaculifera]